MFSFFSQEPRPFPGVARKAELKALFPADLDFTTFQWCTESQTFPIMVKMLHLPEYRMKTITGNKI